MRAANPSKRKYAAFLCALAAMLCFGSAARADDAGNIGTGVSPASANKGSEL